MFKEKLRAYTIVALDSWQVFLDRLLPTGKRTQHKILAIYNQVVDPWWIFLYLAAKSYMQFLGMNIQC